MTSRERKLVQGAAAILIAAVLVQGAPAGAAWASAWRERATARLALAGRARAELGASGALETRALAVRARFDRLAPSLVVATSRAEAHAALAAMVEQEGARHRTRVLESHPVIDSAAAGRVERLTLRLVLESDLSGLLATVRGLESGAPVVEVRALRIHATNTEAGAPVEVLQAEAMVSAWMVRPTGAGE